MEKTLSTILLVAPLALGCTSETDSIPYPSKQESYKNEQMPYLKRIGPIVSIMKENLKNSLADQVLEQKQQEQAKNNALTLRESLEKAFADSQETKQLANYVWARAKKYEANCSQLIVEYPSAPVSLRVSTLVTCAELTEKIQKTASAFWTERDKSEKKYEALQRGVVIASTDQINWAKLNKMFQDMEAAKKRNHNSLSSYNLQVFEFYDQYLKDREILLKLPLG